MDHDGGRVRIRQRLQRTGDIEPSVRNEFSFHRGGLIHRTEQRRLQFVHGEVWIHAEQERSRARNHRDARGGSCVGRVASAFAGLNDTDSRRREMDYAVSVVGEIGQGV